MASLANKSSQPPEQEEAQNHERSSSLVLSTSSSNPNCKAEEIKETCDRRREQETETEMKKKKSAKKNKRNNENDNEEDEEHERQTQRRGSSRLASEEESTLRNEVSETGDEEEEEGRISRRRGNTRSRRRNESIWVKILWKSCILIGPSMVLAMGTAFWTFSGGALFPRKEAPQQIPNFPLTFIPPVTTYNEHLMNFEQRTGTRENLPYQFEEA